jgi:hypothetical protein
MVNFALPPQPPPPVSSAKLCLCPQFNRGIVASLKKPGLLPSKSFLIIYSPSSYDLRIHSLRYCQRCKINRMLITIHLPGSRSILLSCICCRMYCAQVESSCLHTFSYHLKQTTSPLGELTADSFLVLHFIVSFKAAEDETYILAFSLTVPVLCVLRLLNLSIYSPLHWSLTNHFRLLQITFRWQASFVCIGTWPTVFTLQVHC